MLNIELEKEVTFELPEGVFEATLMDIRPFTKQTIKGKQDWIRLIFEVQIPGKERLDCRAGRNFVLSFKGGSDLRNFLTSVLGRKFFLDNSAKTIDLEKLIKGSTGQITLSHFYGGDYDRPLVVVDSFVPKEGRD